MLLNDEAFAKVGNGNTTGSLIIIDVLGQHKLTGWFDCIITASGQLS